MATILGVSCNYHDAAAALVVDGQILFAQQEERLSRVKNDPTLPRQAIAECLKHGRPDAVVFYENPYAKLERVLLSAFKAFPKALRQFPRAMASQLGHKVWVLDHLAAVTGVARQHVTCREHHESHAASAYYPSGYEKAAVLTVDAVGEDTSTAIWLGEGTTLTALQRVRFPHSLGLLYAAITAYLGFEVNEGEYKVMGLAAFGKPRFDLKELLTQTDDGFMLALDYFDAHTDTELGFGPKLERLLGPRRRPDEDPLKFADVAASLQRVTEDALLALARQAKRLTGADALCLAGGVALNAVANARLYREAGFSRVFVQPAAGDAGAALGAALLGALDKGDPRCAPMRHAALGVGIDAAEAYVLAQGLGLHVQRVSDPVSHAADALTRGEIIAWATGRCEFGPRALGQRSICALPAPIAVKERINRVIKRREPFRPFAPAALAVEAHLFGPYAADCAPFMVTVADVKEPARLAAVTHVDGTARLQIADASPGFSALLPAVKARTGTGVVLNTSLNGKGDPIVARAADALAFWVAHSVDAMYVEDLVIMR